MKQLLLTSSIFLGLSIPALGANFYESEDNGPKGTPDDIDQSLFTTDSGNGDIQNQSARTVSIHGNLAKHNANDNHEDWFEFEVEAGTYGFFDVDYGQGGDNSLNSYLQLVRKEDGKAFFEGTVLASNSDNGGDPGSEEGNWDSAFGYNFTEAGTYYLAIWTEPEHSGGDYTIHASLSDAPLGTTPAALLGGMLSLLGFTRLRSRR